MTRNATHTAAPAANATALTPARKGLIRKSYSEMGTYRALAWLCGLPSFAGISRRQIQAWAVTLPTLPERPQRRPPAPPVVTQANEPPAVAVDEQPTGEWYTAQRIADGLGLNGVAVVYGWKQFGWLPGGPLYTAENIRAFFRHHPLEIKPRYLSDEQWLWLVSVLAGTREGVA